MEGLDISLEPTPKPRGSKISKRQSNTTSKKSPPSNLSHEQRIKIEDTFFRINFYFGGCIESEIERVIPQLIEQFKDKEDLEMSGMAGLGDLAGAVDFIRMNIQNICGEERSSSNRIKIIWKRSSIQGSWVDWGIQ